MRWRLLAGLLCLPLAFLLLGAGGPTDSASARIVDLEVAPGAESLLLSFRLAGAFDENLARRIESGLPTEVVFQLEVERDRKRWFDSQVDRALLRVVAMYNALNREYLINTRLDGTLIQSRVVREAEDLEAEMTRFVELAAFELPPERLAAERLRVRVRAELGTRTILFFIPATRTTPWATSDVIDPSRNAN